MKHIVITSLDMFLMGGVERTNSSLSKLFRERGHKVTLISFFQNSDTPFFDFNNNKIVVMNNSPHGFKHNFFVKIKTVIAFLKCCKYLNSLEDDYVLISSYPRTSILFSIFFSGREKVIAHEHSSFGAHNFLIKSLRLICYKKLRSVITLTNYDKQIFSRNGINCCQIPNFSDFKKDASDIGVKSGSPLVCLSAGRMHPHKGFDRLIEIAKELAGANIKFVIVGSGPEEARIKGLVETYSLNQLVSIFPATDNLDGFIDNSDVFLMTSTTEAAPLVMLEAFAHSKPVIAYDCPIGPRELITDGINGFLVNDGDRLEFVTKLKLLLGSPILYNALADGAANYAKKNSSEHNYKLWAKHF
jgi:glycosyltransferase involved in cell wall biosynthesis